MNLRLLTIAALVAVLVPAMASATMFTTVTGSGDCSSWLADVGVQFRTGVMSAELAFTITIENADGVVLDTATFSGTITRDDPDMIEVMFVFGGEWNIQDVQGDHVLRGSFDLSAPFGEGLVDEDTAEFMIEFTCAVTAAEPSTWSGLKALYQ